MWNLQSPGKDPFLFCNKTSQRSNDARLNREFFEPASFHNTTKKFQWKSKNFNKLKINANNMNEIPFRFWVKNTPRSYFDKNFKWKPNASCLYFRNFNVGKLSLVVAHALPTLLSCVRILVLANKTHKNILPRLERPWAGPSKKNISYDAKRSKITIQEP